MCVCVYGLRWKTRIQLPHYFCSIHVIHSTQGPVGPYYNLSRMNMTVTQSCLILCDPMDCSPPGFSVHGILQARGLEWVALPSSRGSSPLRDQTQVACFGRQILYHLSHQGSPSCLLITHGLLQDGLAALLWVKWMWLRLGLHNEAWYHLCSLWLGFHMVLLKSNLRFRHFKYNKKKNGNSSMKHTHLLSHIKYSSVFHPKLGHSPRELVHKTLQNKIV